MIGLGIDAGASSSRWLLLGEDGSELGHGRTGPITGHVFTPQDREENLARLRGLLEAVLAVARPDAVVAGVTGLHPDTEVTGVLAQVVTQALDLDPRRVLVTNDMHVAYANVFAPGAGILVYAGTGSVAYHLACDGTAVRAGGYGYLIDDAGAGYWIGHHGLRQTMRRADEVGRPAALPLDRAIYEALGSSRWEDIVRIVYGGGRARVAALAPAVARAAGEGDDAAVRILEDAGRELARLAGAVRGRLDARQPIAFSGGIARLSPILTEALRAALPAGTAFEVVVTEPVRAAARQALELAVRVGGDASG